MSDPSTKETIVNLGEGKEVKIGDIVIKNLGLAGRRDRIKIGIGVRPGVHVLRGELVGREKKIEKS